MFGRFLSSTSTPFLVSSLFTMQAPRCSTSQTPTVFILMMPVTPAWRRPSCSSSPPCLATSREGAADIEIAHQLISACTTGVGRAHISCYASAQQLLCDRRYRVLRLITLILPTTSKGYSEDYLRKTDAKTIVLTSNSDSTYKAQRLY